MIHLESLSYTYPGALRPVLAGVSLHVAAGELALVTGASGSGKSTLLRCLNGLVPHFSGGTISGRIRVAGRDPVREGPQVLSRVVGFVFQDPEAQFVVDRVEDEVAFALEQAGLPPAEMRARVEEALGLVDLWPLRERPLETLSGGERQRVAIASALAMRPQVLVLDEPTSQLDPASADDLLRAVLRLNRECGLTVVLAEHRLERVIGYASRLIHLRVADPAASAEVLSGPPREVLAESDIVPPVTVVGRALGWHPLPMTVEEARQHVLLVPEECGGRRTRSGSHAPLLEVRDLCHQYGARQVLRGISLDVGRGDLVALMGPNGSGKTTLLRAVVGLLKPTRGSVRLDGREITGRSTAEICQAVGYLPQEPDDLLFADSVRQELEVTLRNHGLERQPPLEPASLLGRLGLAEVADAYPRDLSVGQRQRVALGAVTVTRPPLLLLDEPTRGMDYVAKKNLVQLLHAWCREGSAVLLVSHDVELVAEAADRVLLLDDGALTADGYPEDVLCVGDSLAPQMVQLFPARGWLTADDAVRALTERVPQAPVI